MSAQRIGGKAQQVSRGAMGHLMSSGDAPKFVKAARIATHLNYQKHGGLVRRVQVSGALSNQPRPIRGTMSKWGVEFSAVIIGTNCLSGTRWRVIRIQS